MLNIIRQEEKDAYEDMLTATAMVIFIESRKGMDRIPGVDKLKTVEIAPALGAAVGQIVLDELIEATEHMDRETLVRWFGQAISTMVVDLMNSEPGYRNCIERLVNELP